MLYSIKLHIGITKSFSLALSICVLFVSLMQSVNLYLSFFLAVCICAWVLAGGVGGFGSGPASPEML